MEIRIIKSPIKKAELQKIIEEAPWDFVKAVVDIEKNIMAIGGEFHADEEALLIEQEASQRNDLWGVNLYLHRSGDDWIEFDSLINIRPSQGNRSMNVENEQVREQIKKIICSLIL